MISKASKVIEIDTKEMCLLCYDPCDVGEISQRLSSLTGFKQLLRYLKINTKELFNCSPRILEWMEIKQEIDVKITFCAQCSLVAEEFDKVYKEYELIQFRFDKCLTSIHKSMKCGDDNPERVREFKKKMQPNKYFDMINASIAINLRDQTFKKCSLKLENSLPRVTIQKIKLDDSQNHNHIKPTSINFNDSHLNAFSSIENNNLNDIYATAPIHHTINTDTENDEDIRDWPSSYDPVDAIEVDPLETDNFLDNGELADIPPNHIATPISLASAVTYSDVPLTKIAPICLPVGTSASAVTCNSDQFTKRASAVSSKTCDICEKSFEFPPNLHRHKFKTHPEHLIFKYYSKLSLSLTKCKDLADKFFQHALSKVDESRSTGKGLTCCFCYKTLSVPLNLKAHLFSLHMDLVVNVVQNLNTSQSGVKVPTVVGAKEKCDQCSKVFASKAQLNKHKRNHSKLNSCQYCNYTSPYPATIKIHEIDQHIVEVVIPHLGTNSTCPAKLSQRVNVCCKKLLKIGTRCPFCKFEATNKYSLRRHMVQRHLRNYIKELKKYLDQDQVSGDNIDGNENQENDDHSNEMVSCQFCPFTITTTHVGVVRRHELEIHTVELVMQHLPKDTCRITCAQGVESYHKNLSTMGTNCPICISTFHLNADLRRHVLNQHFDALVREIKDYLGECQGGGYSKNDGNEESQEEPVDAQIMEFGTGTDYVKLEMGTGSDSDNESENLFDPLV